MAGVTFWIPSCLPECQPYCDPSFHPLAAMFPTHPFHFCPVPCQATLLALHPSRRLLLRGKSVLQPSKSRLWTDSQTARRHSPSLHPMAAEPVGSSVGLPHTHLCPVALATRLRKLGFLVSKVTVCSGSCCMLVLHMVPTG